MSILKSRWILACLLSLAATSVSVAVPISPMKIRSCGVKASNGTVVFTLDYAPSARVPKSLLIVVAIKSEQGEDVLLLNYRKDTRHIVVPSSGQVLLNDEGYAEPKKGTISFKLPERTSRIYDVAGLKGSIHVMVYEDKEEDARMLGEISVKNCLL